MALDARPHVGLLILDLDDTVWTWFDAWHASFTALLKQLKVDTGLNEDALIPAIKSVHEHRGTTEYSWLLDELEILEPVRNGKSAREVFDSALHAQNSARKRETRLYPGVDWTLRYAKANGVKIVAYTESLAFWTEWRMRLTNLDGIIDVLYSSPDHDFPEGQTAETVRTLPDEEYGMKRTLHKHVAPGIAKPNPSILLEIIAEHAIADKATVYVGDSLDRDVEMAQAVQILDVHAKYGEKFTLPEYQLLRDVTHWKSAAVDKEKSIDVKVKAVPTYVLDQGFFQLLELFDFATPVNVDAQVAIWKETIGVQMHFNDIGWRIRALGLTVLTFTLAAVGFVYINTGSANLFDWAVSPALMVPFLGAVLWTAFWFADRGWFHKLLIGSVIEGANQEQILTSNGVRVNLGGNIGAQSPIKFYRRQSREEKLNEVMKVQRVFRGQPMEWHSALKLNMFYWIGFALLAGASAAIAIYGPHVDATPSAPVVNNNITVLPPSPAPLVTMTPTPTP
jgi:phosphoglycolate phosphatase-like HAD superfamily hydrolase